MIRHRFNAGPLAVLLAGATLALAACGGSSGNSSAGATSPASGGADVAAQSANSNKLEKFAQCMRAHGVPNFPDPVNGQLQLKVTRGSGGVRPNSPQFKSAQQACQSLAPGKLSGGASSARQEAKALKFSACMRSHGVPKFPDPTGGGIKITSRQGVDPDSPQFKSAVQTCRKLLPGGGAKAEAG